jgi:predicted RNA binding protein YcfA (HicA-like mRNA interferase family)
MILRRADPPARIVVPDHRDVRIGTLRQIINDAGLSVDEFVNLL